jgi:hypothetical protein
MLETREKGLHMKAGKVALAGFTVLLTVILVQHEAAAKKAGTSILHFMVRSAMSSTGFDADATGSVDGKRNQQGNADNQRLEIVLGHLDGKATYALLASTLDDTNFQQVATIDTDGNGVADVKYVKKNKGKASPGGDPLPNGLDPISDIRALVVSIGGTQDVLGVDLTFPDHLQYLIKRAMDNDDNSAAMADLRIKATQSSVQFRIRASDLTASSAYYLAVNGDILENLTSESNGDLKVDGLPNGSPDVLDITSLAILDGASNSVLSTTLP